MAEHISPSSPMALGDAALLFRQRLISAVGAPIGAPQISNNIADLRWTFGAKKVCVARTRSLTGLMTCSLGGI
jgi:hypothetical protein